MMMCKMAAVHQSSINDDSLYLSNSSAGQTLVLTSAIFTADVETYLSCQLAAGDEEHD